MLGVWWTCKDGAVTLVDRETQPLMEKYTWRGNDRGSIVADRGGKRVVLHRLIVGAAKGQAVDHANHDRADNLRTNLRICTQQENNMNRRPTRRSKTGYKGVYPYGSRFEAKIGVGGKQVFLGYYQTATEAARAYNAAARKFHGEYARLNEVA